MKTKTKDITMTALMAAVLCVLGPISVPIGPVPISLGTFGIYVTMYVLGAKRGTMAVVIYLLLGLVGLPVFTGLQGGLGKLIGPTGGYLIGYIPMAFLSGLCIERFRDNKLACILSMELATWLLYMFGTWWLSAQAGMTYAEAFAAGVLPFIAVDLCKIVAASFVGPAIESRIDRE